MQVRGRGESWCAQCLVIIGPWDETPAFSVSKSAGSFTAQSLLPPHTWKESPGLINSPGDSLNLYFLQPRLQRIDHGSKPLRKNALVLKTQRHLGLGVAIVP